MDMHTIDAESIVGQKRRLIAIQFEEFVFIELDQFDDMGLAAATTIKLSRFEWDNLVTAMK